ncbi:MAG: efflux RND transporter periplasmic adaptor subunit, partial [Gemmatimonadaceae bacterium]
VQGQAIQAGMELLAVANLSDVWIDAQLREADAGLIAIGTAADVDFASYPGRTYKGRVAFIYPMVAEQTRTIRARITVGNADGRLKPGMYGSVHLLAPTRIATTIPRDAVIQTGTRTLVFVDIGSGKLAPRDVELGRVVGDLAEVLSGLEVGQRVVTSAQFLIDSESNFGEVMRSMIGTGIPSASGGDMKGMDMATPKGADMSGMPGMAPPAKPARPPR